VVLTLVTVVTTALVGGDATSDVSVVHDLGGLETVTREEDVADARILWPTWLGKLRTIVAVTAGIGGVELLETTDTMSEDGWVLHESLKWDGTNLDHELVRNTVIFDERGEDVGTLVLVGLKNNADVVEGGTGNLAVEGRERTTARSKVNGSNRDVLNVRVVILARGTGVLTTHRPAPSAEDITFII